MTDLELRILGDLFGAHPIPVTVYSTLRSSFFLDAILFVIVVILLYVLKGTDRAGRPPRLTPSAVAIMALGSLVVTFVVVFGYHTYIYWWVPDPKAIGMLLALQKNPWILAFNFIPHLWVAGLTVIWIRGGRLKRADLGLQWPRMSATGFLGLVVGGLLAIVLAAFIWSLVLPGPVARSDTGVLLAEIETAQVPGVTLFAIMWVVMVAIGEEILFRAVMYGALRERTTIGVALPLESLLFALYHARWNAVVPLFVSGCVLTYLYELKGSLYIPILVHAGFLAVLVLYLTI
ncbi:MAG: type II CAAX endopeptidase family protein [Chloroflexi bacterium]|nr:type II CAAX endopeptidase family protein [Chloroflexota bacterium]